MSYKRIKLLIKFNQFQVNELQRISKTNTGKTSQRSRNFDCQQKLLTAHQLALQGFQAYQNHLPTSVPKGIPDKLKELLNSAIALCDVHRNLINCDINLVAKREDMINVKTTKNKLGETYFVLTL